MKTSVFLTLCGLAGVGFSQILSYEKEKMLFFFVALFCVFLFGLWLDK